MKSINKIQSLKNIEDRFLCKEKIGKM